MHVDLLTSYCMAARVRALDAWDRNRVPLAIEADSKTGRQLSVFLHKGRCSRLEWSQANLVSATVVGQRQDKVRVTTLWTNYRRGKPRNKAPAWNAQAMPRSTATRRRWDRESCWKTEAPACTPVRRRWRGEPEFPGPVPAQ